MTEIQAGELVALMKGLITTITADQSHQLGRMLMPIEYTTDMRDAIVWYAQNTDRFTMSGAKALLLDARDRAAPTTQYLRSMKEYAEAAMTARHQFDVRFREIAEGMSVDEIAALSRAALLDVLSDEQWRERLVKRGPDASPFLRQRIVKFVESQRVPQVAERWDGQS